MQLVDTFAPLRRELDIYQQRNLEAPQRQQQAQLGALQLQQGQQGLETGRQNLQINQIKLDQIQNTQNAIKGAGGDLKKAMEATLNSGDWKTASLIREQLDKQNTSNIKTQLDLFKVSQNSSETIAAAPDESILDVAVQQATMNAQLQGTDPAQAVQVLQGIYNQGGPAALRQAATQQALSAKDRISKIEMKDIGGSLVPLETNPNAPGYVKPGVMQKTATPLSSTPSTDIDDFVVDANAESVRVSGKPLTPGQRNEARLQIKRAQASEVSVNRFAVRNADAATAELIKRNETLGIKFAEIETVAALIQAKGEITPEAKKSAAKARMSGSLSTLTNHYLNLDSTGAILNVENKTFDNVMAAVRSSTVGQQFGRITGTNEQSIRNSIKKLKPLLIQDIRQATDMGARGLDSEKELEFYLQAATDEKTDIQSNIAAIIVLDQAYGSGMIAEKLLPLTSPSLISSFSERGKVILEGSEKTNSRKEKITTPSAVEPPPENRVLTYDPATGGFK
jgi:hypothetical protein